MPNPLFFDCVSQAVELGYTRFDLTPLDRRRVHGQACLREIRLPRRAPGRRRVQLLHQPHDPEAGDTGEAGCAREAPTAHDQRVRPRSPELRRDHEVDRAAVSAARCEPRRAARAQGPMEVRCRGRLSLDVRCSRRRCERAPAGPTPLPGSRCSGASFARRIQQSGRIHHAGPTWLGSTCISRPQSSSTSTAPV